MNQIFLPKSCQITKETIVVPSTWKIVNYADNIQHVISGNTNEEIHEYLEQLHEILIEYYKQNSLVINAKKLIMCT